jgi:hypothetical protein
MDVIAAVSAVVIFLVGQFVLKLMLEPGVAARRTIADARTTFDYYANVWANPPQPRQPASDEQLEASSALRRAAGQLRAAPASVLGYRVVRRLLKLPSESEMREAASNLIGLSNNLFGGGSHAFENAMAYSDAVTKIFGWKR